MNELLLKLSQWKQLIRNTSWLLSVEFISKVSRLVTIVALTTLLPIEDYGTVMLALAVHEVVRMILRSGAGSQVVQCAQNQLGDVCKNANSVQWVFCLSLAGLQLCIAPIIGHFYHNPQITVLLASMALVYSLYPIVSVRIFLLQRENRMKEFSIRNGICIAAENLSIALFAIGGLGIYSVVLGKWIFAICWLIGFYKISVTIPKGQFQWTQFKSLLHTSSQLVFTELSKALRFHLDTLIAGRLLAPDLFGIYCFAKSAGVGITQSLSNAFITALFPYLCKQNRLISTNSPRKIAYLLAFAVGMAFVIQALLAPIYVPIIFSDKWQLAIMTTSLLCLVGFPAILLDTLCAEQRSKGQYHKELYLRIYCLLASLLSILAAKPNSSEQLALTMLISTSFWLLCFMPRFIRMVLTRPPLSTLFYRIFNRKLI